MRIAAYKFGSAFILVWSMNDRVASLADANAKITKIPKSDIDVRRVGDVSIMPANLVEALSPGEFADLVGFLLSLKQPQSSSISQEQQQRP